MAASRPPKRARDEHERPRARHIAHADRPPVGARGSTHLRGSLGKSMGWWKGAFQAGWRGTEPHAHRDRSCAYEIHSSSWVWMHAATRSEPPLFFAARAHPAQHELSRSCVGLWSNCEVEESMPLLRRPVGEHAIQCPGATCAGAAGRVRHVPNNSNQEREGQCPKTPMRTLMVLKRWVVEESSRSRQRCAADVAAVA